jgi:ligand-binding sensor domain-containing protein/signal transduction histidine kinase
MALLEFCPLAHLSLYLLFFVSPALTNGQTPTADSINYSRRVWQRADGLPEDFAQALARTPDGYLWIGTSGGLVRFDGIRLTVFNRENQPAFQDDSFYSLHVTRDGTLWGGTEGGGLVRYQNGAFRAYSAADGLSNGFVRVIFEDRRQTLWVGTDRGLFKLQQDKLIRVDETGSLPRLSVHTICEDRAGRLLVGGSGLLVLDGANATHYTSSETLADNSIRTIRQTADGALWIGTISGLRHLPEGLQGDPFKTPRRLSGVNISVMLENREGALWIGTYGDGLRRYHNGRLDSFAAPAWLPSNHVLALFDDGEDDLWVGTQGGLLRLSPSTAVTLTTADGAASSINTIYQDPRGALFVTSLNGRLLQVARQSLVAVALPPALNSLPIRNVYRDRDGALWLGTDGQGIVRLGDGAPAQFTMKQGLVNDFVRAFCEDGEGNLWIGTDAGLSRKHDGSFQNFNADSGLAYGSIRLLLPSRNGGLWIGTDGGLSRWHAGAFVADPLLEGLRGHKIWALHEDRAGSLWIGTHGAGLFLLKDGRLRQFTVTQGLPGNKIHFIVEDAHGQLWLSGPSGVMAIARRELENFVDNSSAKLAARVYDASDGLSTHQMNGGVQPAGALAADGKLWIPTTKGAVCIEPKMNNAASPFRVSIERVLANDHELPLNTPLTVPSGGGKLEIQYSAPRLRAPEDLRFKYWLEGVDPAWSEAGQRRIAYYTNVPAGTYNFHIIAYESNDPRHAAEQILSLQLQPHFYQTAWFKTLCALLLLAGVWGAYRLHVRNLRQRFVAVLDERNRLAREMHDTLIQGCVGVSALLEAAASAQAVSPSISTELLDRARKEVRAAVNEARLAVWNLRQSSGSGEDLVKAVTQLAQRTEQESGVPVRFASTGAPCALGAAREWSLLMVTREALQNAVRHAAPRRLSIELNFDRRGLDVAIKDDGCGFDPTTLLAAKGRHYGLIGMRERIEKLGGQFQLTSVPGHGTQVSFNLPTAPSVAPESQ